MSNTSTLYLDSESTLKAAEQGHAEAQLNLGWMYQFGRNVPQNYEEAIKWFRKAAEQGHAGAQLNLPPSFRQQ